jgi:pimeloyl-ACP methyl ester carboxylesterase
MASTTDSPDFNTDNISTLILVGDHRLSISLHGPPRSTKTDPLLILIPGTAGTTAKWPALIRALSPLIRILSLDRPGLGDSDPLPTPSPPTLTTVSNDIHALLKATNLQPPYILLGHSWGGMLSTFFATTCPSSVMGLILLDAGAPSHPPLPTYNSFTTDPGTPFTHPCVQRTFQRYPLDINTPDPETSALTPDEIEFLKSSTSTPQYKEAAGLEYQGLLESYLPFLEKGWLSPTPNERYTESGLKGVKIVTVHGHAYKMFQRLFSSVYVDSDNNDKPAPPDDPSFETDKADLANLLVTWKDRVRQNQEQFANLTEPHNWLTLDAGEETEHDVMVSKEGVGKVREGVRWVLDGDV